VALSVGAYCIQQLRIGGPQYQTLKQISDFNADILPPSQFVVEPFMETALLMDEPQTIGQRAKDLHKLEQAYQAGVAKWRAEGLDPKVKELHGRAINEANQFWSILDTKFLPAVERGDMVEADRIHDQLTGAFERHRDVIRVLKDAVAADMAAKESESQAALVVEISIMGVLALAVFAMIALGIRTLLRRALDPLAETAGVMGRMAAGDYEAGRTSVHREDEIGDITKAVEVFREAAIAQREGEARQAAVVESLSGGLKRLADGNLAYRIETPLAAEYDALRITFNDTVAKLADLLQRVAASAQSVSTGAGEIRAASDDLAMRNEQQAASLEETAASMNQVTGIVKETADNAVSVQRTIASAHEEASEGGQVVTRAVEAMSEIERGAQEITQIINVIDGIAFQTNLLALNAGVEAARAGDAGKGFAVVANEVRALAQRSADAAKDIKALITASTEQVAGGVRLVGETGELLEKIVTRVGEISSQVSEIARSAESQSVNLGQVNVAVSEMDRMTQQNAAMVEQSTAAARSLAAEASELSSLVSQFDTGSSAPASRPAAEPTPLRRAPPPPVHGNLALKQTSFADGDDWTEF
jgi:methyl-accepting chemotaxis protein